VSRIDPRRLEGALQKATLEELETLMQLVGDFPAMPKEYLKAIHVAWGSKQNMEAERFIENFIRQQESKHEREPDGNEAA
jgi:hypothetical protein